MNGWRLEEAVIERMLELGFDGPHLRERKFPQSFVCFMSAEVEGWSVTREGDTLQSFELLPWIRGMNDGESTALRVSSLAGADEEVGVDAGVDHLELVSRRPCVNDSELLAVFQESIHFLRRHGVECLFCDRRPEALGPARWNDEGRYRLLKGIMGPRMGELFVRRASTHYHIGACGFTDEGVQLLDTLNNVAPTLANVFGGVFGSPAYRNAFWTLEPWVEEERLPAPRRFGTSTVLVEFLMRLPHLLTPDGKERDGCTRGSINDQLLKCLWWLVRPSRHGTIEARFLSSMPPEGVALGAQAVNWIVGVVRGKYPGTIPAFSEGDWYLEFSGRAEQKAVGMPG